MKKILVIAPHSDDETIGLGGSLLKWKSEGHRICIVLMSCFDSKMVHKGEVTGSERQQEFIAACEPLSTEPAIILKKARLEDVKKSELVSELDKLLYDFKPDIIVYPEPSYHQDHQIVNQVCTAALRPTKKNLPSLILTYEVPTSTWVGSAPVFTPNYYVDIEDFIERKLEIFESAYRSQFTKEDRVKLASSGIKAHAQYRALECGLRYAEAFRMLVQIT